ncbi:MAG TPA: hypothetical protein VIK14_16075 [Ignavibacteria bacterium]
MILNLLIIKICILLFLPLHCLKAVDTSKHHTIPFKLVNNKVLVPVNIGNSRTFDLILDSGFGFDGIILFNRDLADSVNLANLILVNIPGAGDGPPSQAIMSESMTFNSGTCEFNNQRVIILQNDLFKGSASDGVIGYTYFGHYKVEVDYDNKIITLHDSADIIDESGWESIPLTFDENNKPHLNIYISIENEEPVKLDVYIDYAASLSIELTVREGMKFKLPEKYEADFEGYGLSGDVKGKTARISKFKIGKYEFKNVTATFFEGNSRSKDKIADGVISNDALRRFNLIFDYQNKKLLIKPNNSFNEPFEIIR